MKEVNQNAVFYGMRAQLPAIAAESSGAIVNIASILGSVGLPQAASFITGSYHVVDGGYTAQ